MSQHQDGPARMQLLGLGAQPQHLDAAQRAGIGSGRILELLGKLLPTLLQFLAEQGAKGGEDRPGGGSRPTVPPATPTAP